MSKKHRRKKYCSKRKHDSDKHISQFALSENNRLTYVYMTDSRKIMTKIVCVSLEIKAQEDWITIIYFDNNHGGTLHRHTRIAFNDEADITDFNNIKRKGHQSELLRWAINDIKNNFIIYKIKFIKRNKPILNNIEIEEY